MTKKKIGRPTKLSLEVQNKIVSAIRAGNYIETAAAYAGINKSTLYDWMRRGEREIQRLSKPGAKERKAEEPFISFSNAIEKALAEAEIRDVAIIGKAAEEQWQAAAWRLERKHPDRWGRKKIEVDMNQQFQGQVEVSDGRIEQELARDPESAELLRQLYRRRKSLEGTGQD